MPRLSPEAIREAQRRFEIRFKRAVLERIEREAAERMRRSPAELDAERDAMIKAFAASGRSVRDLADSFQVTVSHVRRTLGTYQPRRPMQLELLSLEGLRHAHA